VANDHCVAGSDGSLDGDYLPDVHRSTLRCTGLLGQPSAADGSTRPASVERRYPGRHVRRVGPTLSVSRAPVQRGIGTLALTNRTIIDMLSLAVGALS
jgi:hypothetical protein